MQRWQKKPWVLPDFLAGQRRQLLISGEVIACSGDIDFERVAGSKSKKIKSIYSSLKQSNETTQVSQDFAQN